MLRSSSRFRAASLAITALCYLLPFGTVSCLGVNYSVTGIDLAFGTTVQEPQAFGPPHSQQLDSEPLALAALACAVIGAVLSFGGEGAQAATGLVALAGGVLLLGLQVRLNHEMQSQTMGTMLLKYDAGYWLALIGYLAVFASAFLFRPTAQAATPPPPSPPALPQED